MAPRAPIKPPEFMSLAEAANWVGMSEKTLRRWISEGTLPAYRFAGRSQAIRLKVSDVEALLVRIPTV
jgi:excisionase family DNA binding protein